MEVQTITSGRYKVISGPLTFEIHKVPGGWFLMGLGDASVALLRHRKIGGEGSGGTATYGTLKAAKRIIEDLLELPETRMLQAALVLKPGEKGSFDLTGIDLDDTVAVAEILRRLNFATYISSGTLAVQRKP